MGMVGLYGAWRKTRSATAGASVQANTQDLIAPQPDERVERVEKDIVALRVRQDQLHQEASSQQSNILKQQTAMFDLLVQQRSTLDKILTKMSGL